MVEDEPTEIGVGLGAAGGGGGHGDVGRSAKVRRPLTGRGRGLPQTWDLGAAGGPIDSARLPPRPMRALSFSSALVLLAVLAGGCDLIDGGGLLEGPALNVDGDSRLEVSLGPTGALRFTVPDSLSLRQGTVSTYGGTIRVAHERLVGATSDETLWEVTCSESRWIGDVVNYGVVPEGCQELTRAKAILPGRRVTAFVQAVRVSAFGYRNGRRVSAAFQMNDPSAVATVDVSGGAVSVSWPSASVDAFGEMWEVGVHAVTSEVGEPTRIASNRVWSLGCDPLGDATARPRSVTVGGAAPSDCFAYPGELDLEPGRYVAVVELRRTAFATLFER